MPSSLEKDGSDAIDNDNQESVLYISTGYTDEP